MTKTTIKLVLSMGASLCLFSAAAFGQDQQSRLSAMERARFLLDSYEVVVLGKFPEFPEEVAADLSRAAPKEVTLPFEISKLYKGYSPYDRVQVRLAADMLRYPGENMARYKKRVEISREHAAELQEIELQLSELREMHESGSVTNLEFQEEEARLLAMQEDMLAEYVELSHRRVAAFDIESFYDLGGSVQSGEEYLVGLDYSHGEANVLVLTELTSSRNIFWGRQKDEIEAALDQLAGN